MLINPKFIHRLDALGEWIMDNMFELGLTILVGAFCIGLVSLTIWTAIDGKQRVAQVTPESKTACIEKKLYKEFKQEYILVSPATDC